jgi:prefoldin subunit 5
MTVYGNEVNARFDIVNTADWSSLKFGDKLPNGTTIVGVAGPAENHDGWLVVSENGLHFTQHPAAVGVRIVPKPETPVEITVDAPAAPAEESKGFELDTSPLDASSSVRSALSVYQSAADEYNDAYRAYRDAQQALDDAASQLRTDLEAARDEVEERLAPANEAKAAIQQEIERLKEKLETIDEQCEVLQTAYEELGTAIDEVNDPEDDEYEISIDEDHIESLLSITN